MQNPSRVSQQFSSLAHHANDQAPFEVGSPNFSKSNKKRFPSVLKIKGEVIPCKPCQLFGLDIEKLECQDLLKNRSYRRLYNIVANDQTSSNQVFRPNLIKQLFFMLQITPFIQQSLRSGFLSRIQQWYNSNDYKKIKLAKSLDGFVKNVLKKEQQSRPQTALNSRVQTAKTIRRPKSGVQWDSSLNPFLRPYTAKIRKDSSQQLGKYRPQSSKFGMVSTNAQTNLDGSDNLQIEDEQQIDDIEQEWERSQHFKNKHRTLHPQEEPTYEKLMSLISKVSIPFANSQNNQHGAQFFKRSTPIAQSYGNKRNIQSAAAKLTRQTNNARNLAEKELKEGRFCERDLKENERENNGNEQDDVEINQEDEQTEGDVLSQSQISKYGKFKSDTRTRQGKKLRSDKNYNHIYSTVNGVKILRPYTAQQTSIISKLDQYSSLEQNKRVMQSIDDQQCLSQFKDYVRNKTKMKKEIVRKSQAKRYMDNFTREVKIVPLKSGSMVNSPTGTHTTIENKTNKIINEKGNEQEKKSDSALSKTNSDKENGSDQNILKSNNFIELISPFGNESSKNISYPTYNDRTYFEKIKKKQLSNQYREIKNFEIEPHQQDEKIIMKMTNPQRLFLEEKFDPFHVSNINNYNKQALEQIQKIKQKFGGKMTVTTDALLKALYIYPNEQKENLNEKGKVFEIPDKRYLMLRNEQNKKKKRKMKFKKGASKPK